MATKESKTVLDDFKKIEEIKKKELISKTLTKIKKQSKEIRKLKYLCEVMLESITTNKEESKSIIDWINELEDVKLTQKEKDEIKSNTEEEILERKEEIEKKIDKNDMSIFSRYFTANNAANPVQHINTNVNDLVYRSASFIGSDRTNTVGLGLAKYTLMASNKTNGEIIVV